MRVYVPNQLELNQRSRASQLEEETIRQLLIRKQDLETELQHREAVAAVAGAEAPSRRRPAPVAAGDQVDIHLVQSEQRVELHVVVRPAQPVHAVAVLAESVLADGESHVTFFPRPALTLSAPAVVTLPLRRPLAADVYVRVLTGAADAECLAVVEAVKSLPTFAQLKLVPAGGAPNGHAYRVRFSVEKERVQRVRFYRQKFRKSTFKVVRFSLLMLSESVRSAKISFVPLFNEKNISYFKK